MRIVRVVCLAVAHVIRSLWWRVCLRVRWRRVCQQSRLSVREIAHGQVGRQDRWVSPALRRVQIRGDVVLLTVRARPGQTVTDLEEGAERLAAAFDAHSFRTRPDVRHPSSRVLIELVMRDALTSSTIAAEPEPRAVYDAVRLGRTQSGAPWRLQVRGRHTLCVGASGAGKGSVLWGISCGLGPAAHIDLVRLWGIDLKRGVELATGEGLFSRLAYTPTDAVEVLRELIDVIDERGAEMVGKTRLHNPSPGDPLHVLVVDELASLTAYAPLDIRREADKLLGTILTQGRALGVVVIAFVQDPRKEVVGMRSLFTQTIALRLRSGDETVMVLGEGMHRLAPAHRINPGHPGTGWVVEDSGAVDRVRADFWSDGVIRSVSTRYPSGRAYELEVAG